MDWKERFEVAVHEGDTRSFCTGTCQSCPFEPGNANCLVLFPDDTEAEKAVLMGIYRHVLAPGTIKDWTDVDEIRARVAEMLDDDAREKFLGKAEEKYQTYHSDGGCYTYRAGLTDENTPEFHWLISLGEASDEIIAAFRDEELRNRVLAFLKADSA